MASRGERREGGKSWTAALSQIAGLPPPRPRGRTCRSIPFDTARPAAISLGLCSLLGCEQEIWTAAARSNLPPCNVSVDRTLPVDGADDAYYRADIEYHLSSSVVGKPFVALMQGVEPVDGTTWLSDDEEVVHFSPKQPLLPLTDYTAVLSHCQGGEWIEFKTSDLGQELSCDPSGRAFTSGIDSGRQVSPGLADLVEGAWLLEVTSALPHEYISFVGTATAASYGQQDMCNDIFSVTVADFSRSPDFRFQALSGTSSVYMRQDDDGGWVFYELELSGTFCPDCSCIGGGTASYALDMRDTYSWLGFEDWTEACVGLQDVLGLTCEACHDGVEACLLVSSDYMTWDEQKELTLVEVEEPDTDPECIKW